MVSFYTYSRFYTFHYRYYQIFGYFEHYYRIWILTSALSSDFQQFEKCQISPLLCGKKLDNNWLLCKCSSPSFQQFPFNNCNNKLFAGTSKKAKSVQILQMKLIANMLHWLKNLMVFKICNCYSYCIGPTWS